MIFLILTELKPRVLISLKCRVYVAGDWAGHDEILADAAVASGKRAALHILKQLESEVVHHGNGAII